MAIEIIDDLGLTNFTDDIGFFIFLDDLGDFLGISSVPPPPPSASISQRYHSPGSEWQGHDRAWEPNRIRPKY